MLKSLISRAHNNPLQFYQSFFHIIIQAYVSKHGLGTCLFQSSKLIVFTFRSLTDAETQYANNERELLAVVYTFNHFHTYPYGHSFMVETEHNPLEMITFSW